MHWINNYSFLLVEVLPAHQEPYCSLLSALSLLQCSWQIPSSPLGISPTSNDFPFIPTMESEHYSTDSQTGDWCRFLLLTPLRPAKECRQLKMVGSVLLQSQLILWTGKAKPKESNPQAGQVMQTHKHIFSIPRVLSSLLLRGGLKKSLSPPKPLPEGEYVVTLSWIIKKTGKIENEKKTKMNTVDSQVILCMG